MRKILLGLLVMVWISACSVLPEQAKGPSLLFSDHPLANKIWDVRGQRFIDRELLIEQAALSEFLLLGETHDNPIHHRDQARMIDGLQSHKRSARLAFEMISRQQGKLIADERYDSVASLIAALKHVPSNWQYEPHYVPLFKSAIQAGFSVRAASLDRENILAIANKGVQAISAPIKTVLDYNVLTHDQEAALRMEIVGSHCGMDHEGMVSAMMLTQRVKDAVMMESLLGDGVTDAKVEIKVLVAGSGHVRKDRGVPKYIMQTRPDAKIVSLAWLEVVAGADEVSDYAQRWDGKTLPFDYVWFTPRVDRPDPCEQFRKHMQLRKTSKAQSDSGV
jgi:uncharacterized iron-regulated protein